MIGESKFSRVLLGNFLCICYVKNPTSTPSGNSYYLGSIAPMTAQDFYSKAQFGVSNTDVSSMIPDESSMMALVGSGLSLYFTYRLLKLV